MDRVKPMLDKLNIKPHRNWKTAYLMPVDLNNPKKLKGYVAYHYEFEANGLPYRVSDSEHGFELTLATESEITIYTGDDIKRLEKKLKEILQGTNWVTAT